MRVRTLGMFLGLWGTVAMGQSLSMLPDAPSTSLRENRPAALSSSSPGADSAKSQFQPEQIYPTDTLYAERDASNGPAYTPLTRGEKFQYFVRGARSSYTFISSGITAATWHAYGDPPYGTGLEGFGKSYGAALSQRELAMFLQRYAMPAMFHEDPRYFAAPTTDNIFQRGVYAASRLVLTQADDGSTKFNCSYMLGGLGAALIGNSYIRQRDSGDVTRDFLVNMGSDAAFNIAREFWPNLRSKFPTKHIRKLGDLVIGPHGLPNPGKR